MAIGAVIVCALAALREFDFGLWIRWLMFRWLIDTPIRMLLIFLLNASKSLVCLLSILRHNYLVLPPTLEEFQDLKCSVLYKILKIWDSRLSIASYILESCDPSDYSFAYLNAFWLCMAALKAFLIAAWLSTRSLIHFFVKAVERLALGHYWLAERIELQATSTCVIGVVKEELWSSCLLHLQTNQYTYILKASLSPICPISSYSSLVIVVW